MFRLCLSSLIPVALCLGQIVVPGPNNLAPFPAATFCGVGIPVSSVESATFTDSTNNNQITLALSATERFASPPVTSIAAARTYFAAPGPFLPIGVDPNRATWNFNYYVRAVTPGGANALGTYTVELYYDMNPDVTQIPLLGRAILTAAADGGCSNTLVTGVIQNSQNLGFDFLRMPIPSFVFPPASYQNPGGGDFDPNALGQYSFMLRVLNGTAVVGSVAINVSTLPAPLPPDVSIRLPNPPNSYMIRYLSNLDQGDSVINITNDGANGAQLASGTTALTTGSICANVYVFSPDEQLSSCCSCPVTPNGLVSLSARRDFQPFGQTAAVPTSMVVKLVASQSNNGSCAGSAAQVRPATVAGGANELAPGMLAWGTSTKLNPGGVRPLDLVETKFQAATLTVAPSNLRNVADIGELARLTNLCTMLLSNGAPTGFGQCAACRAGALGGVRN